LKRGADRMALALKNLTLDDPLDRLELEGSDLTGPVLTNGLIVVCTDHQVAYIDLELRSRHSVALPDDFKPALTRGSSEVTLLAGGTSLAARRTDTGVEVWVVGVMNQRKEGVLMVNMTRGESRFRELSRGSALALSADGSVCLSEQKTVEVFGAEYRVMRKMNFEPKMPAFMADSCLVTFGEKTFQERHRVNLMSRDNRTAELKFEDMDFDSGTCCGAFMVGEELVVASLNVYAEEDELGLKFVGWSAAV